MTKTVYFALSLLLTTSLTLAQSLNPGQIGNDQSICYRYAPKRLSFIIPPSGGTAPYTYRWQRSNDLGSTYAYISGTSASNSFYSPPGLARTALFRCEITDAASTISYTNFVTITVAEDLTAGVIEGSQTVYTGTLPLPLSQVSLPSGGVSPYTYQWQRSSDGLIWSDLLNSDSPGYIPEALIEDMWFRRLLIDAGCGSVASNSVFIDVNPISIYTTELPAVPENNWGIYFDFGTEFRVLENGFITKVRLYTGMSEGGLHHIRLWKNNDLSNYDLLAGPIEWNFSSGTEGWREFTLETPVVVEADTRYIISISTSTDNYWAQTTGFSPVVTNDFIQYLGSLRISPPGQVPNDYVNAGVFRDIVFVPFSGGTIGQNQTICFNTTPLPINQLTPSEGAAGGYLYQWQSSVDSLTWINIPDETLVSFSPPPLTGSTYFRRLVTSGGLTAFSNTILITVDPLFSNAQLQGNIEIYENTSTFLKVLLTGGTPPYTIEYTRNNISQSPVTNYLSGTDIYTGILPVGTYEYSLTSVTDALGCDALLLGGSVTVTASGTYSGQTSNAALVIVNSLSDYYYDYNIYIRPYLDWFGVPFDTCNLSTMTLPDLSSYGLIIFGHRNVYESGYPISALESAVGSGAGLYSFDAHLFDFPSAFSLAGATHPEVTSSQILFMTDHFITERHENDIYHPTNNTITLRDYGGQQTITVNQTNFSLTGGIDLAYISDGGLTEPILEAAEYIDGKIIKWSSYDWIFDSKLGPVWGMDDLIWRSIVWAARKPFVMQGVPPIITMRVDDVDGTRSPLTDLKWLKICNEYGFIPWCGTFVETSSPNFYSTMKQLVDNGLATASPHAFSYTEFIYYNLNDLEVFDAAANVVAAWDVYEAHSLEVSKYILPHWNLLSSDALQQLWNRGVEFIGNKLPCDPVEIPGPWLNAGPYKIKRSGWGGTGVPYFYADSVDWVGEDNIKDFFISATEIGDDGGYEWYPTGNTTQEIAETTSRGVRHLRRAFDSMVLATLFTHEDQIIMPESSWRQIISQVTSAVSSYNPVYKSMDDAARYVRAKVNLEISDVTAENELVSITCSGDNDMETQCYLFTDSGNQISFRLVTLPMVSSTVIPITICVTE
jgi:hypothetical protein